jgi:hypothetical protein
MRGMRRLSQKPVHVGRDMLIIRGMHSLRRARHLALMVLAWFVLSLGVALIAPVFAGNYLPEEICSVAAGEHGSGTPPAHVVHCPACVHTAAPPPAEVVAAVLLHAPSSEPAAAVQAFPPQEPRSPWTARGPPSLS